MKATSIIFRPTPGTAALLRGNAVATGRTMTDLIESALRFYLDLKSGEYPDIQPDPVPVALQLDHPGAHFYDVQVGEKTVSGLFAGHDDGQSWSIDFDTFADAAGSFGLFRDYDGHRVWFDDGPDETKGHNAHEWAAYWLQDRAGTTEFTRVLKDAVDREFQDHLHTLSIHASRFHGEVSRLDVTHDADCANAITELARIVRAINREK